MSETTLSKTRTRWTATEVEYLRNNATAGAKAIAEHLGRSEGQVRTQATKLRVSLRQAGSTRGRKLTAGE
jgi:predicted transcriptional regulator